MIISITIDVNINIGEEVVSDTMNLDDDIVVFITYDVNVKIGED